LAQLRPADREGQRDGALRHVARHAPRRSAFSARRFASRPRLSRRPRPERAPLLHQLGLAAVHSAGEAGGGRVRPVPDAVREGEAESVGKLLPPGWRQRSGPSFVAPLFVLRCVRFPSSWSAVSISTGIACELSEPSSLMRAYTRVALPSLTGAPVTAFLALQFQCRVRAPTSARVMVFTIRSPEA